MTIRDNEERLGVKDNQADAPISSEQSEDPVQKTLSISVPTEFVELPSGGRFYPEGHALHGKDTLELRYMTAKEEDILNSPALIKKGIAIERMLQSLVVEKISTEDMLIGDKNALVIAARVSGYGEDYSVSVKCPSCGEQSEHDFNLEEKAVVVGGITDELKDEVKDSGRGTFLIKFPKLGDTLEARLLTGRDEKELSKRLEFVKKNKKMDGMGVEQLKLITASINGVTDRMQIARYLENIPPSDAQYVRGVYQKLVPDVDLSQDFTCPACLHTEKVGVPMTVGFFWPNR